MYNNIDTEHAIQVFTWRIRDLEDRNLLPPDFPVDAVLSAMQIITKNNLFESGNLFFVQLLRTAMGTSAAVMWATIYTPSFPSTATFYFISNATLTISLEFGLAIHRNGSPLLTTSTTLKF